MSGPLLRTLTGARSSCRSFRSLRLAPLGALAVSLAIACPAEAQPADPAAAQPAAPAAPAPQPPTPATPPPATPPAPPPPAVDDTAPPPSPRLPFTDLRPRATSRAVRDPADDIVWRDEWPRFQTWQYVVTGVQAALAFGSTAIPGGTGRIALRNGFDDDAREALRAETYDGYLLARDVSDVGIVLLINHRIADSAFVTWWGYDKGSVAWEMAMIDLQTVTFTAAVNGIVAGVTARERPYGDRRCLGPEEEQTSDCLGSKRYRSFFSGHSSTAFTLAGLTCMHHANIPLYGHPVADGAACVGSLGAAGTVALMRVVADQHWISDTMVGSAFGLTSGLALPWIFHYSGGAPRARKAAQAAAEAGPRRPPSFAWTISPTPGGATVSGAF